ncbi:MAG: methyltransferase domain-containing protein [Sulfurifustaceae bacterium]
MKTSALRFLVCPQCRQSLDLHAPPEPGSEIMEGALSCRGCRAEYPITRGVPRFVRAMTYASSFGRQWNWFRRVQLDSHSGSGESERTLHATTGWTREDYRGRLVLDAGVGCGRFAEIVAQYGGEVVGIDLTDAVDAAYANIGRRDNVHLIQADIFAMPFRAETFDLVYSIGVLHHTPEPRAAFDHVAAMVKPGGGLAVYLYHGYGPGNRCADVIRRLTTRLPLRLMFALSTLAIPLYYLYQVPVLGNVLRVLCPISLHANWRWRWLDTFDWYTPKYQFKFFYPEIFRWFRANGFADVEVYDDPIRMRGAGKTSSAGDLPVRRPLAAGRVAAPAAAASHRIAAALHEREA